MDQCFKFFIYQGKQKNNNLHS